ncbi:MAG: hypothetical protein MZW92_05025 [Comamonadaceae bacterium]|nr:hypothetical protein [Comamonadaceae bacterium]
MVNQRRLPARASRGRRCARAASRPQLLGGRARASAPAPRRRRRSSWRWRR